jgi:hypothetical protein
MGQPGPRASRTEHRRFWACDEHRAEVEAIWAAWCRSLGASVAHGEPLPESGGPVSGNAPEPEQGALDL